MRLRRQVENQIERAKERALEEVWKTVGDVSTSIAERLIDKSLKGKDHNQLIDKSIKEIRERMEAS
jgi:F0F1-type ATP synthase membrane subunit b/b'